MKLRGLKNEAWVTCATNDHDAESSIVLAQSLKRVLSNRDVVIMVSAKVSMKLRALLYHEFDFVFILDEGSNTANLKLEDFGKLSALTLKSYDKCCYVSPNMLFLKNADEIFITYADIPFACPEEDKTLPIYIFKPSVESFVVLTKALGSRNGSPVSSYIQNWFYNQYPKLPTSEVRDISSTAFHLGPQFNRIISLQQQKGANRNSSTPVTDTYIVNFLDHPIKFGEVDEKLGLIDFHAIKIWKELHYEHVETRASFINGTSPEMLVPSGNQIEYVKEPIAIVGMSCRYPSSRNLEEFWQLLFNGEDGTGEAPPFRWLREQCSRNRPDCRKTNAGFLNVPVDEFDAKFFGISPKEVHFLDPQIRLLHEVVWEGLEDAAIDPMKLRGSNAGVFMGSWTNDYKDILRHSGENEFYRTYMGNSIGGAAARISFLLGLTGPSVATESGCSSAMVAVHLACKSLLLGQTNLAVACGVNLLLHPFDKDEMPMVISPQGRCRTFDAKADGFARAEGCGVLVLKRLSEAVKDGDHIWGMIRGTGMSQEGVSRSMGTPTIHCESLAMKLALEDAHVDPLDVSYVEAHGTGTIVGDPLEISAIAKAYGSRGRKERLLVGSVKTNVGHTESCSGITGIMKVILAMHHEMIPPHRNFDSLNPNINLDLVPATIPLEPKEWKKYQDGRRRLAGVSSFGITGTDAHAIIEEPPTIKSTAIVSNLERPQHILKISAKTEEALELLLEKYADNIEKSSDNLADIFYTANTGRANFAYRAVIIGKSKEEVAIKLRQSSFMKGEVVTEDVGKICFLFTGQGSQYPGMAKELYETNPIFKMHFDYCDRLLQEMYDINIMKVLWGDKDKSEVDRTIYSQTSIFCVEYAMLKMWESWGIKPDYALGHSLGEFAAAVCAGILKPQDAIKLVAERSRLIDDLATGKMLVIKANKSVVEEALKEFAAGDSKKILDYAAINSNEQTVVAGDSEVVLEFSKYLSGKKNLKSIILDASHAFHSKHMDPILEEYRKVAKAVEKVDNFNCEYISGMKGALVDGSDVDAEYWVQHTRQPVNFLQASKIAAELGCQIFVEVGPQPVLSALTMMNTEEIIQATCLPSLKKTENDWDTLLQTVAKLYLKGLNFNWFGFDELYSRSKVRLPHYPFMGKKYWPDMMAITGNSIHPLLGSVIPNASSTKLFQNGLNLRCVEYVKDHVIGQTAVYPGAGYLEMALAAGYATVECSTDTMPKPTRPMKVENLTIAAPLALEESKTCQVQIVVDFNTGKDSSGNISGDWNDLTIKIFHRMESKWLHHATASFIPVPTGEEINSVANLDVAKLKNSMSQPSDSEMIRQVYEKLASVGLKFGPTFQSLEKVWKLENETMLAKVKLPYDTSVKSGEMQQYIVHPAILDAMIQAVMINKHSDKIKKKLYVPISISKFLWLANPQGEELYVYTKDSIEGRTNQAVLIDEMGTIVASMSGIELIDTTVKAVESVLEQQTTAMPDLWEECWRAKPGPLQHRIPQEILSENYFNVEFFESMRSKYNAIAEDEEPIWQHLEELVFLWMLKSFYECGWNPEIGQRFTTKKMLKMLNIIDSQTQLVNYFLEVLGHERILQRDGKEWEVISIPPTSEHVSKRLAQPLFRDELVQKFDPTRLINRVGEHLSNMLKGEMSGLQILFPENAKNNPTVSGFYDDYMELFRLKDTIRDVERKQLSTLLEKMRDADKIVLRVLEVGGGTGVFTNLLLPLLEEHKIGFEYTFTDISPAFFPAAEKRFENYKSNMVFKKLNIEEDPISQGLCPGYYDLVIASDVIHATRDICQSLRNCRKMLRSGGMLHILEQIQKNRVITFVFGLMDGFWRFEDFRKSHCIIEPEEWKDSLSTSGFERTTIFPIFEDKHGLITSWASGEIKLDTNRKSSAGYPTWLIFSTLNSKLSHYLQTQLDEADRKVILIRPSDNSKFEKISLEDFKIRSDDKSDFEQLMQTLKSANTNVEGIIYLWSMDKARKTQEEILQPYFYIAQTMFALKQKVNPRLLAITHGVAPVGDTDLSQFHTSTLWGFTKSFRNENPDLNCRCIGIENEDSMLTEDEMKEVYHEIWCNDMEPQVAFSNKNRHVARFQAVKVTEQELTLPSGTNRFQIILPETKTFADLTFGPMEPYTLEPEEVEIQVYASALNFRDVFTVLKPSKEFEQLNAIGLDFSGTVKRIGSKVTKWKVGDCVFGVNNSKDLALPSHIKAHEQSVVKVPDFMTLPEASTLPAVFSTSYYCLIDIAQVTKDDTVLVHTASGGVGLSAIQLLQNIGAKIIATAGSKRKQNLLRSLGIQHIFNSRSTEYGDQILKLTNGKGVDVVLNSLTSEGFKEATLKACAKGARFVEMSKLSIWEPEEVKQLRPDVKYTIVDLTKSSAEEWKRLLNNLQTMAEKNVIKAIPYVRFDAVHIREALQYLQKAKHVGKVVCVMPQFRMEGGEHKPYTPMFNDRSTYLITGGLGGIGFEVGKWMVKKGAKHILLASRSPPNPTIKTMIQQLNAEGANLIPISLDVGNFEQCKNLLERITKKDALNLPPLRGVMHAAGTLADGFIANQTWSKLSSTFNSKILGTLNLHHLTKDNSLEHFVLFSSIASLYGTPGQCNHAAGNQFEDAITHYRHSVGLCATTVNWGQWGETGVAVEVDLPGMKALSNLQGITALEYALKTQRLQTCAMNMESFVLFSKLSPQVGVYLDEKIWKAGSSANTSMTIKSDEFWQKYDSQESRSEKVDIITNQLKDILRKILKLDEDEAIEEDSNLQEMGVDSLMFVEIKNAVQALLGERVTVSANALRDCNTAKLLSEQLMKLIEGDESAKDEKPPTDEEVSKLIREDSQLAEHITALGRPFKDISKIKTVLLTGVTGTLGPYMLKELTNLPQIREVYCLIRPNKSMSVEERLRKTLEFRDLQDAVEMEKVKLVIGNVWKPNLGLEDKDWRKLTESIDCIFHCAVRADHTQYYRKRDESSKTEDVRAVNVTGTKNILEFACQGQVKQIYMASTLLSVSGTDEDGTFSESWPTIDEYDGVTNLAYPISKFVGDLLLKTAVLERGIPAKVFRLPLISGDSKTGKFNIDQNHMMLRYMFIMKSGIMPSNPFPMNILPVDICASASVKLFFHEKLANDIYNIAHPTPDVDQEFVFLSERLGHPVEIVEFDEFKKKLMDSPDDSTFSMFKEIYRHEGELLGIARMTDSLTKWLEGVENFWRSKKISAVYPEFYDGLGRTIESLERDIMFAKKEGWLEKFGL